jgi:hypothetical protein
MRLDIIADGKPAGRHEFICQPRPGDTIQLDASRLLVSDFCHNLKENRLQVICSKAESEEQNPRRNKSQPTVNAQA